MHISQGRSPFVNGRAVLYVPEYQGKTNGGNMLEVEKPTDLIPYAGKEIGVGDWLTVTQQTIDTFADATGDHQWIHVDVERCKREIPGGRTIAHGYLTLSLMPQLGRSVLSIRNRARAINYGSNRIRFIAPVHAGDRIRARQTLKSAEPIEGGVRLTWESTVEVETDGKIRAALVAETIVLGFD